MEIEQVAEMARTIAALPQAERDFFDGMVADERAKAADAARTALLQGMTDQDVIEHAFRGGTVIGLNDELMILHAGVLRVLREAGFVRNHDDPAKPFTHTQAEVDEIVRLSNEITKGRVAEFIGPDGYVERAYRAGFEASGEGWNFEIQGQEVFDDPDFHARLERDFELLLADFEDRASA